MGGTIGDTLWTVGEDGTLRATFGAGEDAIQAHLVGSALGTGDPIRLTLRRAGSVIHASEHGDVVSALDAVEEVVTAQGIYPDQARP